jgi:predicted NAD/FAD-binding protein
LENGKVEAFDHVIIATHGDQALSLIGPSATKEERAVLSAFTTTQNEVVLHSDPSLMPTRRKAWAGLNYATQTSKARGSTDINECSLTYNMNILQGIPQKPFGDVFVTLNPFQKPQKTLTHGWYYYSHPRHTIESIRAQKLLSSIQNRRGISYAGAWTKYGLHEDGFSSGLAIAMEHLGARLPFEFKDTTYSRGRAPKLGLLDHVLRLVVLLIQIFFIQVVERLIESGKRRAKPYVICAAKKVNGKAT